MSNVILKKSRIQGIGVFAGTDLKKGETIMKWDTNMTYSMTEANSVPQRYRKYLVYNKGRFIMAQSPEKYLNHSCNANTFEKNNSDVARRDIRKGEELTTDYSLDAPPHIKMRCNCKEKGCKNII